MTATGEWEVQRSMTGHNDECERLAVEGRLPQPLHPDLREWVQDMSRFDHIMGETVLEYLNNPALVPGNVTPPPVPKDAADKGWGRRFQLSLSEFRKIKSSVANAERLDRSDVVSVDLMVRASQAYWAARESGGPPPPQPPPGSFDPSSMIVLDYTPQSISTDGEQVVSRFFLVYCSKWQYERGEGIFKRGGGRMVYIDGKANLTKYSAELTSVVTGDAGGVGIPLVQVLSVDKSSESRVRAMRAVFKGLPFLVPSACMVDGELAYHSAVRVISDEFFRGGLALRSCVFHILQCVMKAKTRCRATEDDFKAAKSLVNNLAKDKSNMTMEQADAQIAALLAS